MNTPGQSTGPFGRLNEDESSYRNNGAVTNSAFSLFLLNEWLYYQTAVAKRWHRPETNALTFGRAFHCALLEPKEFDGRIVVWPGERRYGKEWDAFKAKHLGKTIITKDDRDMLNEMQTSVYENKAAQALINECETEVVFRVKDLDIGCGMALQCRVDGISPFGSIIDLKSTDNLKDFRRSFYSYGYHRQAVWYSMLVEAVTGKKHSFTFIAVEKKEPYAVGLYKMDELLIEQAREEIEKGLERLAACLSTGDFKRDDPAVQVMSTYKKWEAA